jgi:hypothetical protein
VVNFKLKDARLQTPLDNTPFHQWVFPDGVLWTEFYRTDTSYVLRFPALADFEVSSNGRTVFCNPAPNISEETIRHLYLNQVLPLALSKLGKLVFHGSAVEVAGAAVACVAESGKGKSTLAASFARGGFRFLTDDGLVVEACGNGYQAMPSHPSIRLWADSEEALKLENVKKAPPLSYTSKSRFLSGPDIVFCDQPRPLRRVYFLGDGSADAIRIDPMSAPQALVEWVKHSFLMDIEKRSLLASHFDQVAKLANQPIHFRLDYPRRFEDLASVRQAIVEHINEQDGMV